MKSVHETAKYISLIYRFVISKLTKDIKEIGLTLGQSILLIGVVRNQGSNQETIANSIFVDKATASRNMRFLEIEGYIEKKLDENNRSSYLVYPTQKGIDKANESLAIQNKLWEKIFEDLSEEDSDKLAEMLELGLDTIKESLI